MESVIKSVILLSKINKIYKKGELKHENILGWNYINLHSIGCK